MEEMIEEMARHSARQFEAARRLADAHGHEWAWALEDDIYHERDAVVYDREAHARATLEGLVREAVEGVMATLDRERLRDELATASGVEAMAILTEIREEAACLAPHAVAQRIAEHHRAWWQITAPVARSPEGLPTEGPWGIPCPVVDDRGAICHTTGTGRLRWRVLRSGAVHLEVRRPGGTALLLTLEGEFEGEFKGVFAEVGPEPVYSRHLDALLAATAALDVERERVIDAVLDASPARHEGGGALVDDILEEFVRRVAQLRQPCRLARASAHDWAYAHDAAMAALDRAEELAREQLLEAARETYEEAAQLEQSSADVVPVDRPRTRGVLRVSAVSLWMRAGRYEDAARLARRYLQEPLAAGYVRELHDLLAELETPVEVSP